MNSAKENTNQFLNKIKTKNLDERNEFVFEIDLTDKRITASSLLQSRDNDFLKLQNILPPSFIEFAKKYSDGLYIDIANALTVFSVTKQNDTTSLGTVMENTNEITNYDLFPSKEFVFFAQSGVDSGMFAFYIRAQFYNKEYPIIWFTPGSLGGEAFVLINSSFDKFLTMQYYWLMFTSYYDYNEPIATLEEAEKMDQNFLSLLYDTFDPNIPKPNHNFYKDALSIEDLKNQIEKLKGFYS